MFWIGLRPIVFNNRDDATARRNVCFAHFFVGLRRSFGAAKWNRRAVASSRLLKNKQRSCFNK
jgi:hypothetical protein